MAKMHKAKPKLSARAEAAILLAQVIAAGKSLSEVSKKNKTENTAFIQELCYGVLRYYFLLNAITQQLLQKPFNKKDADLQALLLIGLYQILYLRVPDHAAVAETVEAARLLQKPWSTKLLNAVLRRFLRERETILANISQNAEVNYLHPQWLLNALQQAWPEHWEAIVATNNDRPPMTIRVNPLATPLIENLNARDSYLKLLAGENISAKPTPYTLTGITLETPSAVTQLPGFTAGWLSVQDAGAQMAAPLLEVQAYENVLDACAAPGGKTTHLLECTPELAEIVAVDIEEQRLTRVKENLQRLNLIEKVKLIAADVSTGLDPIHVPAKGFDRILLDVPCSATGVIRRHPDIKLLRRMTDIQKFVQQQQQILKASWSLLKKGGRLLYVTCSILPQENEQQIADFLVKHADAKAIPIEVEWGLPCRWGRQILPGMNNMDGFYYACLEKQL